MRRLSVFRPLGLACAALFLAHCGDNGGPFGGDRWRGTLVPATGSGPAGVIVWGNATGTPGGVYNNLFDHFAASGYTVISPNDSLTGDGETMVEALDWVLAAGERSGSSVYGKIDPKKVVVMGHSQGGASAVVVAGKDSRVAALVSLMPDCNFWVRCNNTASIRAPSLLIAGSTDILVRERTVRDVYDKLSGPAALATIDGLGHMGWFSDQVNSIGRPVTEFLDGALGDGSLAKFKNSTCRDCGTKTWKMTTKNL